MPNRSEARTLPEAASAEAALLGICLVDAGARSVLAHELVPEDFYSPTNAWVADVILELHRAGSAVDTLTVSARLADKGLLDKIGGPMVLIEYIAEFPATTGARSYARLIADAAARRRLMGLAAEMGQMAGDRMQPVDTTIHDTLQRLRALDLPSEAEGPDDVNILLAGTEDYDWVVPKLLERGDRLMITSTEGAGKSMMLAQMAVQMAAGVHPFRREHFDPVTTLLIDVENGEGLVRRRIGNLIGRLGTHVQPTFDSDAGFDRGHLRVRVRSEGIDLLSRNDRRWFTERIMANEPAVVLTGPIYKMHRGNAIDEEPAREIAAYFDDLRETYGITLIIEAHSPYGKDGGEHRVLRPFGASLWSRWPEFGFGMRMAAQREDGKQAVDWVAWRGARDEGRYWPKQLIRGGHWPWENAALLDEAF